MKMSAGAPFSICLASAELAPYEITGLAEYCVTASSSAFFRLAAARMVWACAAKAKAAAMNPINTRIMVLSVKVQAFGKGLDVIFLQQLGHLRERALGDRERHLEQVGRREAEDRVRR